LVELFRRASRYGGKGCLYAVDNVHEFAAPLFEKKNLAGWNLLDIDRALLNLELSTAKRRGKIAESAEPGDEIQVMQRKQNLGMNAVLSISLALARGVAHVRGQDLYEFLREELLMIIERLAAVHRVTINSSRFEDYIAALREVNTKLEDQHIDLHVALRNLTGIYEKHGERAPAPPPPQRTPALPVVPNSGPSFDSQESEHIAALDHALIITYGPNPVKDERRTALRTYLKTMGFLHRRYRMFEIANHRIFKSGESLIVPYDTHGSLTIHEVKEESTRVIAKVRLPHGTLVTDDLVAKLSGRQGEVIDLEREIYHLDIDDTPAITVSRLRDLARLLGRLNTCGSRHEAVYLLRFLVARLCSASYRGVAGAKNLKPEIVRVRTELIEFMNGPFARRLRLPTRILVRSISGLVSRPKLIDEVWQDTIDLSEVHVRGSTIANEIRRSTHHGMGKQTLRLARAYLEWLQTGETVFPEPDREVTTEADDAARSNAVVVELVTRIVNDLEQLLGTSQMATRIGEWRESYTHELLCCESSNSLDEELESLLVNGIQAGNRWVYQHRLRSMVSKARDGAWSVDARDSLESAVQALQQEFPDEEGFQAERVAEQARAAVTTFSKRICNDHRDVLFSALDELLGCYQGSKQFEAFERSSTLRRQLNSLVGNGVFSSQRYLLHQLDCLLEELGFFALRHVASGYVENGMNLAECLRIVFLCAGNLDRD
ncbi:MAG: hypothetical protein MUP31_06740, partial [Xanthomonadales bacterium]|nr:hypothetical protein [Xanthomonadales bacterium]